MLQEYEYKGIKFIGKEEISKFDTCLGCAFYEDDEACQSDTRCRNEAFIWVKDLANKSEPSVNNTVIKDSNPKDAVGVTKSPLSVLPMQVVYEAALGMYEGALKYGAFNYRVAGVRASVYYDAVNRHLNQWFEGQDTDEDSGLNHITKAITTLMVMRDAMLNDKFNDDRPPKVLDQNWMKNYNEKVKQLQVKYPNPIPRYTWKGTQ